jgi:hypothetical protein
LIFQKFRIVIKNVIDFKNIFFDRNNQLDDLAFISPIL